MPRKYIIFSSALIVMIGHVALVPFIYFYLDGLPRSDKNDLALLIAPLTAAYFITITRYIIDNAENMNIGSEQVNILYTIGSIIIVVPFIAGIYFLLFSLDKTKIDFGQAKAGVGLIEVFFGGAFALFVDNLFGKKSALPVPKP